MKWEPNSNYSHEDLLSMQQDAINRVQEMQRRADTALQKAQRNPSFYASPPVLRPAPSPNQNQQKNQQTFQQSPRQTVQNSPDTPSKQDATQNKPPPIGPVKQSILSVLPGLSGTGSKILPGKDTIHQLMKVLKLDNERLLILLILFVLYNEGADYTLLFALLYLFL